MEDKDKPSMIWFNIAAVFSLVIGLLYFYGDTFETGFIREFSLSRSLFLESFEQTLVTGVRLLLQAPEIDYKGFLVFLFGLLGISGIFWTLTWIMKKTKNRILLRVVAHVGIWLIMVWVMV